MPRVFISYVRENSKDVQRLVDALKTREIEVWFDQTHVLPGDRWADVIRREISRGDFFIACYSAEYINRSKTYMNEELTLAIDELRQRPTDRTWFIPVQLSECEIPDRRISAGETLRSFHCEALYKDWDGGIKRILSVIQPHHDSSQLDHTASAVTERGGQTLDKWHIEAQNRFEELHSNTQDLGWASSVDRDHYVFSYLIGQAETQALPISTIVRVLSEVSQKVREFVWNGWSMFFPLPAEDIKPYFLPGMLEDIETDIVETNLLVKVPNETSLPDFWRVSTHGAATLVRAYREDRVLHLGRDPETFNTPFFAPRAAVREVAELVRHAQLMALRFTNAETVSFVCTWKGLKDRKIQDFEAGRDWPMRIARAEERTTRGDWPLASLDTNWPSIVAQLLSPVTRLFDGLEVMPEQISRLSSSFRI